MHRFFMEELPELEEASSGTGPLSARVARLILSSREITAKVYDSDARTGMYVVVLEGMLEPAE